MIVLAMGIGLHSLTHGFKKHHHRILPIIVFVIGISLLLVKQVLHQYQIWFLVPAVVLIVSAHFINYRQCRIADHCHNDDCKH
jgi:sulfite exporter TauE/SafE